jgi:hypothetical protein
MNIQETKHGKTNKENAGRNKERQDKRRKAQPCCFLGEIIGIRNRDLSLQQQGASEHTPSLCDNSVASLCAWRRRVNSIECTVT